MVWTKAPLASAWVIDSGDNAAFAMTANDEPSDGAALFGLSDPVCIILPFSFTKEVCLISGVCTSMAKGKV